jgi:hypothetical protein
MHIFLYRRCPCTAVQCGMDGGQTAVYTLHNNQISIGKSILANVFKKSQEKNPQTKCLENFAKALRIS